MAQYAERHDLNGPCAAREPAGGLLRLARQQGHATAHVNAYTVKISTVESGDTGKTDPSDAGGSG